MYFKLNVVKLKKLVPVFKSFCLLFPLTLAQYKKILKKRVPK